MISTLSNPLIVQQVPRRQADGTMINANCPDTVFSCTKYMHRVDKSDQLRQKYPIGKPSNKVWKYIVNFLLSLCSENADRKSATVSTVEL